MAVDRPIGPVFRLDPGPSHRSHRHHPANLVGTGSSESNSR
jgi:hypothetical protein